MLSASYGYGVRGDQSFGIPAREPKTTYHALRLRLDLRIWKSKDFFLFLFFSCKIFFSTLINRQLLVMKTQTLPPRCPLRHRRHPVFSARSLVPAARVSEASAALDLDNSGLFPSRGSLQLSRASPSPHHHLISPPPTSPPFLPSRSTPPPTSTPAPPCTHTRTLTRLLTPVFAPPGLCLGH